MKNSVSKKRVIICVAALFLTAVFIVLAIATSFFTNWNAKTWFGRGGGIEQAEELERTKKNGGGGGAVITDTEENGIQLFNAALPRSAFAANGVSDDAESAYQLTATVAPTEATNVTIAWSSEWADASNAWIAGKETSTFITVTPSEWDCKIAMIECMQPFGAQILVRVSASAPDCETKTAVCAVDYLQKVEEFSTSFGDVECNFGGNTDVTVQLNKNGIMQGGALNQFMRTSDVFSIADEFQVEYSLVECKPFLYAVQTGKDNTNMSAAYTTSFYAFGSGSVPTTETNPNVKPALDYSTLRGYSVAESGLFFGVKWFYTHLGFSKFFCYNQSGADGTATPITDFSYDDTAVLSTLTSRLDKIRNVGDGGYYIDENDWKIFVGGLDLFNLHVTVTGAHSSFEMITTFHIAAYSVALDSVSIDSGAVIV